MFLSSTQREPTREYLSCVEREEELDRLRNQAKIRKSMLVFGPEGVGKSRLLNTFVESHPLALYVAQMRSPREFLLALLQALHSADEKFKVPGNIPALSSSSLKGIAHRALDTQPFFMVLDHLDGPSRVVTGMIKDLHYYGRTPVIFASRSPHMEDIGALRPLCALKSEQIEIRNWPEQIALEFAQRHAERIQLWASNLDSILPSLVEWSDGNPGAILQMLKMLTVPKLRTLPFETAIIERYKRRESSVEEALIEMYLAGVSVRRVEDITQALWGTRVSASTVSDLNQKIYGKIDEWRERPLVGDFPYVFLDGLWLKRSWGGEVKNVSVLVAIGVAQSGYREILAVSEGAREDKASWIQFLRELKDRGLKGVELFVSDKCLGLVDNLAEFYPEAKWQRCIVHFYRNVWTAVPTGKVKAVTAMLKAIHAQEDAQSAKEKARQVAIKLREMRLARAAEIVEAGIDETLSYYSMPSEHWRCLRTNNPLERLMREIRRRTRVVGAFPDGKSALMLVAARLRHVAATKWGTKRYLQMNRLAEVRSIA